MSVPESEHATNFPGFRSSDALADAVRREHELRPDPNYSGPADLHLKSVTSGDIDGDGDIDLWVDSIGGANVSSHFMVNNGDGTFTLDVARAPHELRHNPGPEYWYHLEGRLVDLDNDGDIDLSLVQNRDASPTTINQFSIVLVNDGTGHYPERIELPRPTFNEGYTTSPGQTHFDVNSDGFQDLLLVHSRNNDALPDVLPFTGRYIQVLINDSGTSFVDETSTRMGDQSAPTSEYDSFDGRPLYNGGDLGMYDVDCDGCADIVVSKNGWHILTASPMVYRNSGSGQFEAMDPKLFVGDDHYFGSQIGPVDVSGDGVIDFVAPQRQAGPDEEFETEDDFTRLVTLLNTTPAGPVRCSPRVTAVGTLPARTLYVGTAAVVVSVADAFQNAVTYQVSSSAPSVATVSVSGSDVTVTAVAEGSTTITVTASGADNLIATQQFKATVTAFTSAPARRSRSSL